MSGAGVPGQLAKNMSNCTRRAPVDTYVQAHFLITRVQKQYLRDLSARDDRAMAVFLSLIHI